MCRPAHGGRRQGGLRIVERRLEQPLTECCRERTVLAADELFIRRLALQPGQEVERNPHLCVPFPRQVVPDILQ